MKFSISNIARFTATLTVRKILNFIKLGAGYHYSKITGSPVHWGLPASLSIEVNASCNLRCTECPTGRGALTRVEGKMEAVLYRKIIDELHPYLAYLQLFFQGEPFLHAEIFGFIGYAHKKGIYTSTATNGHFLSDENARKTVESGLDKLIISIDGCTQEVYEKYRVGGDLQKVIAGAKNIVKWKQELGSKTPYIVFQFLVIRQNQHQMEEIKSLGKELGADKTEIKTAQIINFKNGNDLIPTLDKYSRYRKKTDGTYSIKSHLENRCRRMWNSIVITHNGTIVPCCFDKDAQFKMGNATNETVEQCWKSDKYLQFRKSIFQSRKEIDMCCNCTEGLHIHYCSD